jgi:hypothetical protein
MGISDAAAAQIEVVAPFGNAHDPAETITFDPLTMEGNRNIRYRESDGAMRHQDVYSASYFESVPEGNREIAGFWLRPDGSRTAEAALTFENFELTLSATTNAGPADMSNVFAENVGANPTVVYSGDLTLKTNPIGPAGGPMEFNMLVLFDTPFEYDPADGNLLLDYSWTGLVGDETRIDSEWLYPSERQRIYASGADALESDFIMADVPVREFIFVPEPSTLLLLTVGLLGLIGCRRR